MDGVRAYKWPRWPHLFCIFNCFETGVGILGWEIANKLLQAHTA